jgi:hypothetical protein
MPFVTQDHRDKPDWSIPGDRCYYYYKDMVDRWKATPRWTTADGIYAYVRLFEKEHSYGKCKEDFEYNEGCIRAMYLAWQVFFNVHVMDYERKKQQENGDI